MDRNKIWNYITTEHKFHRLIWYRIRTDDATLKGNQVESQSWRMHSSVQLKDQFRTNWRISSYNNRSSSGRHDSLTSIYDVTPIVSELWEVISGEPDRVTNIVNYFLRIDFILVWDTTPYHSSHTRRSTRTYYKYIYDFILVKKPTNYIPLHHIQDIDDHDIEL